MSRGARSVRGAGFRYIDRVDRAEMRLTRTQRLMRSYLEVLAP